MPSVATTDPCFTSTTCMLWLQKEQQSCVKHNFQMSMVEANCLTPQQSQKSAHFEKQRILTYYVMLPISKCRLMKLLTRASSHTHSANGVGSSGELRAGNATEGLWLF